MFVFAVVCLLMCLFLLRWSHLNSYELGEVVESSYMPMRGDVFLQGRQGVMADEAVRFCDELQPVRIIDVVGPSRREIVELLCSLLSLTDHALLVHCERTAEHIGGFAKHLGLSDPIQAQLVDAARVHLLGLLGAQRGLLSRLEHGLNMEERAIWEFHAILGGQKLEAMAGLKEIAQIIKAYMSVALDPPDEEVFGAAERATPEVLYYGMILKICSRYELELSRQRAGQKLTNMATAYALQRMRTDPSSQLSLELLDAFGAYMMAHSNQKKPERELASIDELEVGMILSRPIQTSTGLPMFESQVCVSQEVLARLYFFEELSQERFMSIFVWG